MTEPLFEPFPKLSRLNRECVISEKIDGTNAQIYIFDAEPDSVPQACASRYSLTTDTWQYMIAGSRTRVITPQDDNYGFAKWVERNQDLLWELGYGRHFGEWWGSGCQRGYGLTNGDKRFSLFNTNRWGEHRDKTKYEDTLPACCSVVPVLYTGLFSTDAVNRVVNDLRVNGSTAAPGFMKPEGVVVYHTAAQESFKVTLEKDESPKSKVGLS